MEKQYETQATRDALYLGNSLWVRLHNGVHFKRHYSGSANSKGVPKRVAVLPFKGDPKISVQATDQFTAGLSVVGFEVVDASLIDAAAGRPSLPSSGALDIDTRNDLRRTLGVQGVFIGSITGESRLLWVDSHLNIRLVSLDTGAVVWGAEVHDPRGTTVSMDVRTSATYAVKNALKILAKDLSAR